MELDHIVLADVVTPRPDGKLDRHGVGWDTIFATTTPATHPRMDLAVRFLLSPHEVERAHEVVLTLVGEDGLELARITANTAPMPREEQTGVPPGRRFGLGLVLTLASIVFPAFGAYQLVLTWDGTEVREPLRLFVAEMPQQMPQP
jgi:uncharacterized protein DUF6941